MVGIGFLMNLNGFEFGLFQVANAETAVAQEDDFKTLLELAENGDVEAQYKIALKYDLGKGVAENIDEALKWYLKAAEEGDALAQYRLGLLYSSGQKVPKDMDKAVKWYGKSAAQGNTWAHLNLAPRYLAGVGVKKDAKKGIDLLTEASELGDMNCQLSLAMYYYMGEYIPKDIEKAAYWFSRAMKQGHPSAKKYLDEINGITKPIVRIVKNNDRKDFMKLYRIKEQINEDESDCWDGGYSHKECMCVLEDEYSDLRQTLDAVKTRHADWEGKNLSYKNKKGYKVGMSLDSVRSKIKMYDQMCKD